MKAKTIFAILIVLSMLITNIAFAQIINGDGTWDAADDGPYFHRNVSGTPEEDTSGSQMSVMPLYVPVQAASGDVLLEGVEYVAGDCTSQDTSACTVVDTLYEAKPLITTFEDGVEHVDLGTGTGFGQRDAFAALSLDDGATWKRTNLSNAADKSSFTLKDGHAYPGDTFRINHYVVGNRVAVAWISRFCESGAPLYSWDDETKEAFLAAYPDLDHPVTVDGIADPLQLYTDDLFGVAGSQGSVDYTLQGFPEVGEIPYGCLWVARGTLEAVEDETTGETAYDIIWRQAERLTSGRRDANRVDITGVSGAGFIVSWQEDPDGLRPGKGLGPGEGWSGAIANSKTDVWYSYIDWAGFDDVCLDEVDGYCTPGELAEFALEVKPKIAVPFAAPMRLTDNNACKGVQKFGTDGELLDPYCYADFDANGTADLCAESESWTNPGGTALDICVTEDGRHLTGRTASTRVRWAIKSYTNLDGETSAWVTMAEEKMKALGTELDENEDPIDIGKNMWYHTFEWNTPELVQQGLMLNAPAIDHETEEMFEVQVDEFENEYYETEISRRFNLMVQGIGGAMASTSKTSAVLLWKEGILFQGGPADIFMRRVVLPDDFDPAADNPFAYENVQCVELDDEATATPVDLLYPDGVNPNYVRGLCPVQGMNLSGTAIVGCDGTDGDCADAFPWDAEAQESDYAKVTEWVQAVDNFNDPSWANPYDVSKGHRGFIDGDFIMMMYATAPNWKANTIGNEAYNLYIRRSFDGGQTWTTLPSSYTHIDGLTFSGDGTISCEDYGWGGQVEEETCTTYGAGEFEQARNVSRLTGSKITVLDPRYSPTGGMLKLDYSNLLCYDEAANDGFGDWVNCEYTDAPYVQEVRDPSAYFVTYETGDNTVVTVDTATVPMDMYYSKAFNFGDDYGMVEWETTDGTELRWDWLEQGPELAEEASVYGSTSGDRFYAVWNQELEIGYEVFTNVDTEFRRIYYNVTDVEAAPSASILYVSTDRADYDDEDIVLIGSARDHDNLGDGDGIVQAGWWVTIKEDSHFYEGRTFKSPPKGFIPGQHDFSFVAQDNEGNWTRPNTVTIWIAEQFYDTYLPLITH